MSERATWAALASLIFSASNFAYQAFNGRDWKTAFDRSFFQTVTFAYAAWGMP